MNNFFPKMHLPQFQAQEGMAKMQHGRRSTAVANFMATEVCLDKCNASLTDSKISEAENVCLRQCYNKYFDSNLIIDNEMTNYTRGISI